MAASAHDGDNHIIPIAIELYDIENELNWRLLFLKLAETIPETKQPEVVIVHDWEKGLQQAQRQALPFFVSSPYVFGTLKRTSIRYSNPSLVVRSGRQQNPVVKSNTMKRWQPIAEINCDAAEYLKNSDSKRWARSHFSVPRFGTVTLNSAESLNSWMKEYRDKSHLGILACWDIPFSSPPIQP
ncbi:hypothetical protein BASA62_004050 [Batrachochytrium salamandrivorans]|nr:hypothetical protein BASA62_004050 [Batrachochytrium salamandrivorans]